MHAIVVACGEKLLGTESTELIPVVGGHHVLPAFATIEREQSRIDSLPPTLVGEHAAVFVIGMRGDHGKGGAGMEASAESARDPTRRDRPGAGERKQTDKERGSPLLGHTNSSLQREGEGKRSVARVPRRRSDLMYKITPEDRALLLQMLFCRAQVLLWERIFLCW